MASELQQLKDIHLPTSINMWPVAPGFLGLLLLFIIACCTIYFWHKTNKRKCTVKFALVKLEKLQKVQLENPENINIAAEISLLLRRTALYYFHRKDVAGLSGKNWIHFLNDSGDTTQFTEETGRLLTDAPYQKETVNDLTPLFTVTKAWLMTISKKKTITTEK